MSDRDPFGELERAFDLFNDQFGTGVASVPTDVVDEGETFVVHADLPGFDTDDIEVQLVEDRKLTVTATASEERETHDGTYVQRERHRQSASRTVVLPEPVDESETSAAYEEGVLTVRLPKAALSDDDGTEIPVN
ncbi:Hsp20/alpha crystallin family protein [Halomicroarcula sp. GCM10025324]|uniref:Hsp20/alpha crystallin family protein n=1 Tax=Haloarcula TaxID=2237 RepID=UPI0023E82A69|nr:Hsp20/alpha crystallin family protein [Halomicroarcula sp. ZS-22-S1]